MTTNPAQASPPTGEHWSTRRAEVEHQKYLQDLRSTTSTRELHELADREDARPAWDKLIGSWADEYNGYHREPEAVEARKAIAQEFVDAEIRRAKSEAWDEGHADGQHNEHEYREGKKITNPYRVA